MTLYLENKFIKFFIFCIAIPVLGILFSSAFILALVKINNV
jgi:hypothetical protein